MFRLFKGGAVSMKTKLLLLSSQPEISFSRKFQKTIERKNQCVQIDFLQKAKIKRFQNVVISRRGNLKCLCQLRLIERKRNRGNIKKKNRNY